MKTAEFKHLITQKNQIQQVAASSLKSIVTTYPYFQMARVLYLEKLRKDNSFKYNQELKKTAAHTRDRAVLFEYITSTDFLQRKKEEKPRYDLKDVEANKQPGPSVENTKKLLAVGKPLQFDSSERYSFNQWLQLSTKKPIERTKKIEVKKLQKEDLINKFIEVNPKIKPLSKDKHISISVNENQQDSSLMTETLAKVYLEQKKYENAIQAYRILSLKYPEKSGFFADQIKRIQILQK